MMAFQDLQYPNIYLVLRRLILDDVNGTPA
jgi:hypothetical protein